MGLERNSLCACGSGFKYKYCCLNKKQRLLKEMIDKRDEGNFKGLERIKEVYIVHAPKEKQQAEQITEVMKRKIVNDNLKRPVKRKGGVLNANQEDAHEFDV